jgi:hypothetical protein
MSRKHHSTVVSSRQVVIARRYRGPLRSANGGYAAGLVAQVFDGPAEVTLRLPPPLETQLALHREGDRAVLLDGDALVAEATPGEPALVPPPPPAFAIVAADADELPPGWGTEEFGECFSCGTRREGDGLAIHPHPHGGLVAAAWVVPREVSPEIVWAAIDCSGAYAVGGPGLGEPVLARMTARVDRLPVEGERCVVIGWSLEEDGRKLHAGTALLSDGEVLAVARQLWIVPRS